MRSIIEIDMRWLFVIEEIELNGSAELVRRTPNSTVLIYHKFEFTNGLALFKEENVKLKLFSEIVI